ncbi:MAG: AmmeMemoRadiSam system protein A [Akkermansiaceae bacterium]|nr:AmmeMemoRadiSam system protein A [Akkermansiaceae bacterium]
MKTSVPAMDLEESLRDQQAVVIAALMPHAPVLVPGVGGKRLGEVASTVDAMRCVSRRVREARPDGLVLVSPHSPREPRTFGIWQGGRFRGSLARFGAGERETGVSLAADTALRSAIESECRTAGIPTWRIPEQPLDHGAVVPLWFLQEAGCDAPAVLLSLGHPEFHLLEPFGTVIARVGAALGRRLAFIASGDMSHRLQPGAPAGYNPDAGRIDQRIIDLLKAGDYRTVHQLDPVVLTAAAEDVTASTRLALAAIRDDPRGHEVLSYEAPFGVGYGVAILHEDPASGARSSADQGRPLPAIARRSLVAYFSGSDETPPKPDNDYLRQRLGVFVTLRQPPGQLRGCVGTLEAGENDLPSETWRVARNAALGNHRFLPVDEAELPNLTIEVSVIHPVEPVESPAHLDPARFGVVVRTRDGRRGVLLPGIPEVRTAAEQLAIARRKATIQPDEPVLIERFRIDKFQEQP